jgi:NAD dependent epimerase/dehydratase
MGRKVLVTGADGFIGSHLTAALLEAGAEVTALAFYDAFDGYGWLSELDPAQGALRQVRGDIRDADQVRALVRGQQTVFHLAALISIPYSYEAPSSYVATNVQGTLNVLSAARDAGVGRVIHTSTSEVYGTARSTPITESHPLQTQSPYAASKAAGDLMADAFYRSFGVPVVILRPFNTFGPRQSERAVISSVIRQALDDRCTEIRVGSLIPKRDFNFVTDTVAAFMALGKADDSVLGRVFNAGSGIMVTIDDVVQRIKRIAGTDKPVVSEETRIRPADSEVLELMASADNLQRATGWTSRVTLDEGLARTIDWWRSRRIGNQPPARYVT